MSTPSTPLDFLLSSFPPYALWQSVQQVQTVYGNTSVPVAVTPTAANPYVQPLTDVAGVAITANPAIIGNLSDWVKGNTNTVLAIVALLGVIFIAVPAFTGRSGRGR